MHFCFHRPPCHLLTPAARLQVIAKIERKVAVRHFESIAHLADGIVISRGNLGLDFDAEVGGWMGRGSGGGGGGIICYACE